MKKLTVINISRITLFGFIFGALMYLFFHPNNILNIIPIIALLSGITIELNRIYVNVKKEEDMKLSLIQGIEEDIKYLNDNINDFNARIRKMKEKKIIKILQLKPYYLVEAIKNIDFGEPKLRENIRKLLIKIDMANSINADLQKRFLLAQAGLIKKDLFYRIWDESLELYNQTIDNVKDYMSNIKSFV